MKQLLITIVAAVLVVGCGPSVSINEAARDGNIEAVKQHLDTGTDVNAKDILGATPLDWAISLNQTAIADLLRKHGGKTSLWLRAGESIHIAAAAGHIEAVKQYLADGVDVNAKDVDSHTPLHFAALWGHKETVGLLIDEGSEVNAKSDVGKTPLQMAAREGQKEIVELLITNGADVNAKDRIVGTTLDLANRFNQTETADLLRKHGGKTGAELKAEGK